MSLLCVAAAAPAAPALSQCPDGTPPPCAGRAPTRIAPPPAAERARHFLVIPFRNLSRSPELEWLVDGSSTLLTDALARWQDLAVVPEERLAPALRRAGLTPGAAPDLASLRRVAETTGGWTTVTGEMLLAGGQVVVRARAIDAATGREVARAEAESPLSGDVRLAFGRVGLQLLRATGRTDVPGEAAPTTTSLDAYRAYVRGIALADRIRYREAAEAFHEAIAHDSLFAQAWEALSSVLLFEGPLALFSPGSELRLAIARAQSLADRLPQRQRDMILARGAILSGQFSSAREMLERRLADDSFDVEAASWLSFTEFVDPVLVASAAGPPHRRGSLNRSIALARLVLGRQPDGHGAYIPIVYSYLLAAGDFPTLLLGTSRDMPIEQILTTPPAALYAPLLYDTIETVPLGRYFALPAESVAAAHARARDAARTWTNRWLAAAPAEGAAYQAAARVSELSGDYETALAQLHVADSLGVEFGYLDRRLQRLSVLGKSGQYDAAWTLADSLLRSGRLGHVLGIPTDDFDALRLWFNLAVMHGAFVRADSIVDAFAAVLGHGWTEPGAAARQLGLTLLAGRVVRPMWIVGVPMTMRLAALDSAWTHRAAAGMPRWGALDTLARWAAEDAAADSALAARAAAAPWHLGP